MQVNDVINGSFELGGAVLYSINIRRILKDKVLAGVSWIPVSFFTLWGLWNCYFYPSLNQWYSFTGGLALVTVNTTWLALVAYFSWKRSWDNMFSFLK